MGRLYQHQSTGFDMSDNFVRVYPWGEQKDKYIGLHLPFLLFPVIVCAQSFSHVRLFETPRTVASQAPLSMGFSRQEYWSGLPCPPPGDLPDPGIEPRSPALQADSLPSEPPGYTYFKIKV